MEEICDYMGVKCLSSIVVENLDPESKVSSQRTNPSSVGCDGGSLSLMDLGKPQLPHSELRKIVGLAYTITTVHCAMPGIEEARGPMLIRPFHTRMTVPLSPALMAKAFSPLQGCQVKLRLGNGLITHWPGHDGSWMDMSIFSCLKVPAVPVHIPFHKLARSTQEGRK